MVLLAGLTACASNSTTPPAAGSSSAAASSTASSSSTSSAAGSSTAGSARGGAAAGAEYQDTEFIATSVTGSHTIAPDSQISLTLAADGTLSARAGCNSMSGKYVVTNGVLLSPLQASTMMACDQALMDQDTWFSAFLSSKPTLKYADGILTLSNGTDTIVFAAAPSGAAAVEGTGWKLTDLISVSGSTVAAVDPTLTAWIRFNAGEVVFNNSCNTGGGSAEIGDTDITFGPLRSTLIFCDGASGALETVMNAVLQGVTPYTVTTDPSGTRLRIMSTDGVTGLGFVADPTVGVDAFPSASASASGSATTMSSG
jgi:heat shock protein HslJ